MSAVDDIFAIIRGNKSLSDLDLRTALKSLYNTGYQVGYNKRRKIEESEQGVLSLGEKD